MCTQLHWRKSVVIIKRKKWEYAGLNPSDSAILLRRADFIKEERNCFVLAKHFAYILDLRNGILYALVQSNKFFGWAGERR